MIDRQKASHRLSLLLIAIIAVSAYTFPDSLYPENIKSLVEYQRNSYSFILAIVLLVYAFYLWIKDEEKKDLFRALLIGFLIYYFFNVIILLHGVFIYPWIDLPNAYESDLLDSMLARFDFLSWKQGLLITLLIKKSIWYFTEYFTTVGILILLYYLCRRYNLKSFDILLTGSEIAVLAIIPIGVIEIFYLLGSETAAHLLTVINPMLYDIAENNGWWPEMLMDRLRTTFKEPAFLCFWASMVFPVLLYGLISKQQKRDLVLLAILFVFCYLTNSSSFFVLLGQISVFTFLKLVSLYGKRRESRKRPSGIVLIIILCLVILLVLLFLTGFGENIFSFDKYIQENLSSMKNVTEQDNEAYARYQLTRANLEIFMDHPVLGVGYDFTTLYCIEKMEENKVSHQELSLWIDNGKARSAMTPFHIVADYTNYLMGGGIIGFLLQFGAFLTASVYLCYCFFFRRRSLTDVKLNEAILSITICAGMFVFGFISRACVVYIYWFYLGLIIANTRTLFSHPVYDDEGMISEQAL